MRAAGTRAISARLAWERWPTRRFDASARKSSRAARRWPAPDRRGGGRARPAPGTPVAAGLIDAHAGGIGTVGARGGVGDVSSRMAYVFGTSACTMSTTTRAGLRAGRLGTLFLRHGAGPWLNEGGQSAAGAAIDHLVAFTRRGTGGGDGRGRGRQPSRPGWWTSGGAVCRLSRRPLLGGRLHVVPEFLGNRAPFADPDARA